MLKFLHARPEDDAAHPNPYANELFWRDVPFEFAVLTYVTPEGEDLEYNLALTALPPTYGIVYAQDKGYWARPGAIDDDQDLLLSQYGHPPMPQNLFGGGEEVCHLETSCGHFWIREPEELFNGFTKSFKGVVKFEIIQSGCGGIVLHAIACLLGRPFKDLGAVAFPDQDLPYICALFDIPFSLKRAFS